MFLLEDEPESKLRPLVLGVGAVFSFGLVAAAFWGFQKIAHTKTQSAQVIEFTLKSSKSSQVTPAPAAITEAKPAPEDAPKFETVPVSPAEPPKQPQIEQPKLETQKPAKSVTAKKKKAKPVPPPPPGEYLKGEPDQAMPEKPVAQVAGINAQSTEEKGTGAIFQVGNTLYGQVARIAQAPVTEATTPLPPEAFEPAPPEPPKKVVKVSAKPAQISKPEYPMQALRAGIEGTVLLELEINSEGRVTSVKVLEGLGYGLDEAAVDAALSWRYHPATINGEASASKRRERLSFKIE